MAGANAFLPAPPIILFGGQGSRNLFSPTTFKSAQDDAGKSPYSALLLSKWHAAVIEESKALDHASQKLLQVSPADFLHQKDLLAPPKRLHDNPLIQSISICLYQLLHYLAELEYCWTNGVGASQPPVLETTGICSGLLSAAVVAASKEPSDVVTYGVEALRLAFSVGARISSKTHAYCEDSNRTSSWCLIATGLEHRKLVDEIALHKTRVGRGNLQISAILTTTVFSITGPPGELTLFQQHLAPFALTKFSHIHGWYHGGESLRGTLQDVCQDIQRRQIKFPDITDLQCPIRSTFDGSLLCCDTPEESLALWVVRHMLLYHVDWVKTTSSMYTSLEEGRDRDQLLPQDLICFGPSSESLFMELRSRNRQGLLHLVDMSPFKAANVPQAAFSEVRDEDVAIVGMGIHLPKGHGDEELWGTLSRGLNAFSEIPNSRFNVSPYDPCSKAGGQRTMVTRYGAFLDNIWNFDNEFFGVSPREAKSMDPQQRILLHASQAALDDAGYSPDSSPSFCKTSFGCYMGVATGDYTDNMGDDIDVFYSTGTLRAFHSGRISFTHNFSGPSITTDTACSSSLVSIYHACRALQNGDCTAALAGGVNAISSPDMYLGLSRGHFLSPSGGCKPFDASADGYCRAEGCAVFVLKRLSDALTENDRIHAIIKSVEVNQSGLATSITHPHSQTQTDLFNKTLDKARIDPATVSLVEAHGTGTKAGDPCELASLHSVFGASHSPARPLVVSSIKGNIGHCEAASGAAGLAKLLLSMRHEQIPVQASFQIPNPLLEGLEDGKIIIPTENLPWKISDVPRRALLNNFGAAGSNGALLLEEFCRSSLTLNPSDSDRPSSFVFHLSAKSLDTLERMLAEHSSFLKAHQSLCLANICYTATARRTIYSHRICFSCSSVSDLLTQIDGYHPGMIKHYKASTSTIFVFSGQGSLYAGMGQTLFQQSIHFRQLMLRCDAIVVSKGFPSFMPFIKGAPQPSDPSQEVLLSQCACFSIEYSLANLLISWNIKPDFVIGHSLGAYAALVISGALSLEDGLQVVAARARLMEEHCAYDSSGMTACKVSPSEAEDLIASDERLSQAVVACKNTDDDCVVSGPLNQLDHLESICKDRKIKATRLCVPFAYHSSAMDPIYDGLKIVGASVNWSEPKIPVVSDVYGRLLRTEDLDADYFAKHARQPVEFIKALRDIERKGDLQQSTFFEIGPHPITLPLLRSAFAGAECTLLPTLQKGKDDWASISASLAAIAVTANDIHWRAVFEGYGATMISLPKYPLQGENFCVPYTESRLAVKQDIEARPFRESPFALLRRYRLTTSPAPQECYELETTMENLSSLIKGHVVGGFAICPASVYHELILEAVVESVGLKGQQRPILRNLQFPQPLFENNYVDSDLISVRTCRRDNSLLQVEVFAKGSPHSIDDPVCTADVLIRGPHDPERHEVKERAIALRQISYIQSSEGQSTFQPYILYNSVFTRVVKYSEIYQTLNRFTVSSGCLEGEGTFKLPKVSTSGSFIANPVFFDTLFHAAGFIANLRVPADEICICGRVDTVEVFDHDIDMSQEFRIYCSLVDDIKGMILADSYAINASGDFVAVARGMEFKRLRLKTFQNVLHSKNAAKSTHNSGTPDLVQDSTSRGDPNTPSSAGLNTPSIPEEGREYISAMILQAVSAASGFPEHRLQSSVPLEDLGIDSMMQIEITSKLSQSFPNTRIDHRSLSDCDTIQALEDALQMRLESFQKKPVWEQDLGNLDSVSDHASSLSNPIMIQKSNSGKTPIFLFHDGSGQVGMYARMGIAPDRPIYAFRDQYGKDEVGSSHGLGSMAAQYASRILTLQVSSVILGGWSFGGVVAFEVARQIRDLGAHVKGLVLIDAPYPIHHQPLPREIFSAIVNSHLSSQASTPKDAKTKGKIMEAFERHAAMLGAYTTPVGCKFQTVMLRSEEVIPTQKLYNVDYAWLSSQMTRDIAIENWRKLVGGSLETLTIPGNHFAAFDSDKVAETTFQVARACDMIDRRP